MVLLIPLVGRLRAAQHLQTRDVIAFGFFSLGCRVAVCACG